MVRFKERLKQAEKAQAQTRGTKHAQVSELRLAIQGRANEIISRVYRGASSGTRLGLALDMLSDQPPEVFWRVLCEIWHTCDNIWRFRNELLIMMARHRQGRLRDVPVKKRPPVTLPPMVKVWRGCSRERVHGLSWTLNDKVAKSFAGGHREASVPRAVLASADIPNAAIFFVEHERNEEEVVLDPTELRSLSVNTWRTK